MLFIQLILYCLSSWYYVVDPADTIVYVTVSTQCFVFMISIYFVWYVYYIIYSLQDSDNTLFSNDNNIYFLTDTSICNSYTWYHISLYIRPTVYKPSAWF